MVCKGWTSEFGRRRADDVELGFEAGKNVEIVGDFVAEVENGGPGGFGGDRFLKRISGRRNAIGTCRMGSAGGNW